eukprot:167995-Amphidinium_carterae.1
MVSTTVWSGDALDKVEDSLIDFCPMRTALSYDQTAQDSCSRTLQKFSLAEMQHDIAAAQKRLALQALPVEVHISCSHATLSCTNSKRLERFFHAYFMLRNPHMQLEAALRDAQA